MSRLVVPALWFGAVACIAWGWRDGSGTGLAAIAIGVLIGWLALRIVLDAGRPPRVDPHASMFVRHIERGSGTQLHGDFGYDNAGVRDASVYGDSDDSGRGS